MMVNMTPEGRRFYEAQQRKMSHAAEHAPARKKATTKNSGQTEEFAGVIGDRRVALRDAFADTSQEFSGNARRSSLAETFDNKSMWFQIRRALKYLQHNRQV